MVFGFSYDQSVVLSQCTVLGNYIIQTTINFRKSHPRNELRPLIYWDVVLTLLPAQIGGSNIGVIVEKVLPVTVLLALSIVVIAYAGYMSFQKGMVYWRKETDELNKDLIQHEEKNIELSSDHKEPKPDIPPQIAYPLLTMQVLAISWAIYAALLVTTQVAVSKCSTGYILTLIAIYPLMVGLIYWGVGYCARRQLEDPSSILPGDILFKDLTFIPPVLAFLIGIMCSLLGIGGGELMGPLLLTYKVMPQVSTATTAMMSLINASSNTLHYAILGEIDYLWAAGVFVTGLCGGGLIIELFCSSFFMFSNILNLFLKKGFGRSIALLVVERYHRHSVLVFSLVTVLVISFGILIFEISTSQPQVGLRIFC